MIEKQNNLSISQNFIKSSKLIESIIREKTSINSQDVVLDIGAGKGVLSFELSKKCQKVFALDKSQKTTIFQALHSLKSICRRFPL